jgi:hypothetical protein
MYRTFPARTNHEKIREGTRNPRLFGEMAFLELGFQGRTAPGFRGGWYPRFEFKLTEYLETVAGFSNLLESFHGFSNLELIF